MNAMTMAKLVLDLIKSGATLRDLCRAAQDRENDKFVERGENGRTNLSIYEFLAETYYDVDILNGPEGPFPVGIFSVAPEATDNPDVLLGSLYPYRRRAKPKVHHPELVEALKRRGGTMWDDPTFSLDSTELNEERRVTKINAYLGCYFEMLASADYLEYEALAVIKSKTPSITLRDLPNRHYVLSEFATPSTCLLCGGGIDSSLAISTLVVYSNRGEYEMICETRSRKVAAHADLYHVAPSAMFQPVTVCSKQNLEVEWGLMHGFYREYLEELFNVKEVDRGNPTIAPDAFYKHPNLLFLKELIENGKASFTTLGMAFNLLNHRPEICTLLLITDESWYEKQRDIYGSPREGLEPLRLCSEFLDSNEPGLASSDAGPKPQKLVGPLKFDDSRLAKMMRPWKVVPPGAAAMVLGARAAANVLSLPEPEWLQPMEIRKR
jgi:hypothetical protein